MNLPTSFPSREFGLRLAEGLGWFSIGLGLAQLLAPRSLTRMLGLDGREQLVQAYGIREIATGIGILSARDPAPWLWGRIAGDALDAATLADALAHRRDSPATATALAAVVGVTALDLTCAELLGSRREPPPDYGNRSGFPRGLGSARGAARGFQAPRDMRTPDPLRPFDAAAA